MPDIIHSKPDNVPSMPDIVSAKGDIISANADKVPARPDIFPANPDNIAAKPDNIPANADKVSWQPDTLPPWRTGFSGTRISLKCCVRGMPECCERRPEISRVETLNRDRKEELVGRVSPSAPMDRLAGGGALGQTRPTLLKTNVASITTLQRFLRVFVCELALNDQADSVRLCIGAAGAVGNCRRQEAASRDKPCRWGKLAFSASIYHRLRMSYPAHGFEVSEDEPSNSCRERIA